VVLNPLALLIWLHLLLILNLVEMQINERRRSRNLHEQIRAHIEKQNEKYRKQANKHRKPAAFQEGDLVWIHL
jgi:hypothetical protein